MYLLDTNVLSELVKKRPSSALTERLKRERSEHLFTSSITVMEMRFGSMLREDGAEFWDRIRSRIINNVRVLEFTMKSAMKAGDILADLQKRGEPIGLADAMIAGVALNRNFTVITGNTRHFQRIGSLKIENWLLE
jgi:predicted nucleic acid-binding protein